MDNRQPSKLSSTFYAKRRKTSSSKQLEHKMLRSSRENRFRTDSSVASSPSTRLSHQVILGAIFPVTIKWAWYERLNSSDFSNRRRELSRKLPSDSHTIIRTCQR